MKQGTRDKSSEETQGSVLIVIMKYMFIVLAILVVITRFLKKWGGGPKIGLPPVLIPFEKDLP